MWYCSKSDKFQILGGNKEMLDYKRGEYQKEFGSELYGKDGGVANFWEEQVWWHGTVRYLR